MTKHTKERGHLANLLSFRISRVKYFVSSCLVTCKLRARAFLQIGEPNLRVGQAVHLVVDLAQDGRLRAFPGRVHGHLKLFLKFIFPKLSSSLSLSLSLVARRRVPQPAKKQPLKKAALSTRPTAPWRRAAPWWWRRTRSAPTRSRRCTASPRSTPRPWR